MYDKLSLKLEDAQVDNTHFSSTTLLIIASVRTRRRSAIMQKCINIAQRFVSPYHRTNQRRSAGPEFNCAECRQSGSRQDLWEAAHVTAEFL